MVRFKNRYIAVEVIPNKGGHQAPFALQSAALSITIVKKIEELYGDFGVAAIRAGFTVKYCNKWTRVALVRVRHGPHRFVASCLPLVNKIDKRQLMLRTLYTGATLRQCYKFIQAHQKSKLEKMWSELSTDVEKREMEEAVMDLTPLNSLIQQDRST